MMHLEEGEKHSFWAESLPAGLSVVRQFDKIVLALWLICIVGYCVAVALLNDRTVLGHVITAQALLACIALPFVMVGLLYIIDRRNIASLVITVVLAAATFALTRQLTYILVIVYLFIGALGVACVVDAIQRVIFYKVVGHIRYANVKEHLTSGDRVFSFLFNIPPDLDTRNIAINPKSVGTKFPWKDMGSTVVLSLIVGMFFWIYLSMNPAFLNLEYTANIPIFIFGITLYVPILILPFSVFKSLDVKIGTNYRDFKLYNGVTATIYRMAVPVFAALLLVLRAVFEQDNPVEVLLYIGFSAVIILFVVFLTSIIYYYAMEATTSADIAKKWKIFIPVPLLLSLHEDTVIRKKYPGTPVRDENDMSDINLALDKRN